MSLRRRMRRARTRTVDWDCSVDLELIKVSAEQLGLTPEQYEANFDAFNERPSTYAHGELDEQLARIVQLAEGIGLIQFLDRDVSDIRAELVQRQGEAFLIEVAGKGTPAKGWIGSHKIHAVNFLARARRAFEDVLCKWFSVGWGRRFTGGSRQSAKAGQSGAYATWIGKGSARRWSSGSIRARTTSMRSSGSASRNSPLDGRAEKSNARPPRSGRVLRCSAARTPEEWALYRLRVQNVLLELQVEQAAVTP